jgi:hypothetical protein
MGVLSGLSADPALGAQTDRFPPAELTVDDVRRTRNREVTPDEAVRFAARGLRAFVLAWGFGAEVTGEELARVLAAYADRFIDHGPHPAEAHALVYGRNDPRTRRDTRIVVACIAEHVLDGS